MITPVSALNSESEPSGAPRERSSPAQLSHLEQPKPWSQAAALEFAPVKPKPPLIANPHCRTAPPCIPRLSLCAALPLRCVRMGRFPPMLAQIHTHEHAHFVPNSSRPVVRPHPSLSYAALALSCSTMPRCSHMLPASLLFATSAFVHCSQPSTHAVDCLLSPTSRLSLRICWWHNCTRLQCRHL